MTRSLRAAHLLPLAGGLLLTAATGCPRSKPQMNRANPPSSQPSSDPLIELRPRFKLTAPETQATAFSVGAAQHQLSVQLLRLEVHDDPAPLASERVPADTLAEIRKEGRDASYVVIEVLVTIDGKPLSDPSVKELFSAVGTQFRYGGKLGSSQSGYVGPAKDHLDAFLHVSAVDAFHGEQPWELTQFLQLANGDKAEVRFSGQGKVPEIQ